jgi:pimeloyl-ACP methyl ester carboxylesterase
MDAMTGKSLYGEHLATLEGTNVVDGSSPMVVLVHGGQHDGWCWTLVQARLTTLGIDAVAPDLPSTGIADEISTVRDIVIRSKCDLVLVGHSRGGRVISSAASGAGNVQSLIYVAAMLLEEHELRPSGHLRRPVARPGMPIDPAFVRQWMYHDVPDELFAEAVAHLRPVSPDALVVPPQLSPAAWRSKYTTYVVCTDDRYIEPSLQRNMASHADRVVELTASHAPFFSRPDEVADIIAEQVRARPRKALG